MDAATDDDYESDMPVVVDHDEESPEHLARKVEMVHVADDDDESGMTIVHGESTEQLARGTRSVDFGAEEYRDLNQVSERIRLDQMEFSEVMVIHRMHIKLSELDLGHLQGAEKVKHLYVFADVVEVDEGESGELPVRFPGSMSVFILCRIWHVRAFVGLDGRNHHRVLRLPHMTLHFYGSPTPGLHRLDPTTLQDVAEPALSIYADVIQVSLQNRPATVNSIAPFYFESSDSKVLLSRPNQQSLLQKTSLFWARLFRNGIPNPGLPPITNHLFSVRIEDRQVLSGGGPFPTSRYSPAFPSGLLTPDIPVIFLTDSHILPAFQTSVLIAELVELGRPSQATIDAVASHLRWLNKLLLKVIQETKGSTEFRQDEYLELSFRAQYLIKKMGNIRSLVVPQLQYSVYSPLINRMAQVAESYDQSLTQFRLFIQQNRILGSFLLEQNRAFAQREKDMDAFHSELISERETELENTLDKMLQLHSQMEQESAEMERARQRMEEAIIDFQRRTILRAVFSIFAAVAGLALAFVTAGAAAPAAVAGASAAVSAVSNTVTVAAALQRIVDMLEILETVMEVVGIIKEIIANMDLVDQLADAPEMPEMPSDHQWLIFMNDVEEVAEEIPPGVSGVSAWKARCKNVAVLGREMITTASFISQLQYEIKVQTMLQEIAKRQAERLLAIQLPSLTNFTEMVTQMDMRTTRILVTLIKVVEVQNAALMYQYLSEPTLVNAWPVTMDTLWRILVQHEHSAIRGLIRLGPSFDINRNYVVRRIPVYLLMHGEDWQFEIPVLHHELNDDDEMDAFPSSWSRVRIHHLEMKFVKAPHVHQPTTKTGSIYILLQGSRIFEDRNQGARVHYEAATSLDYHYAYRLDTGETTLSNFPSTEFTQTFMRMTPFTTWRLRLSASARENEGLTFPTAIMSGPADSTEIDPDATTEIAITFSISAIRHISF